MNNVVIPRYENLTAIGSGGFSQVYEAWQPDFDRLVAVKILTLRSGLELDRHDFERECRAMGSVSEHPNIVTVYDSGFTSDGAPYIAMERYQETLLDRIKTKGPLPLEDILDVGVQLCAALQRASDAGILHRDIKPQNIFFNNYGDPVLADFGIASVASDPSSQQLIGMSIHYAAPEVVEGATPTIESDLYSLGATMYTALAGHRPFASSSSEPRARLTTRILTAPPPPITTQQIAPYAERLVLGLLAKHPNDRPRSAVEAAELFRSLQLRMSLPATPLRVAEVEPCRDDTIRQTPMSHDEGALASSPGQRPDNGFDDASSAVTSYRPQQLHRRTSDFAEPPRNKRPIYGLAILVGVLALGAIGVYTASRSSARTPKETATITAPASTVVDDLTAPKMPTGIRQRTATDGIVLSWVPVEEADRYLVEFTVGDSPNMHVDEPLLAIESPTGDLCFTIRSISVHGRPSRASSPTCVD